MPSVPLESKNSIFPPEMEFRGKWRTYQLRLLDSLRAYLETIAYTLWQLPVPGRPPSVWRSSGESTNARSFWRRRLSSFPKSWAARAISSADWVLSAQVDWAPATGIPRPELPPLVFYFNPGGHVPKPFWRDATDIQNGQACWHFHKSSEFEATPTTVARARAEEAMT